MASTLLSPTSLRGPEMCNRTWPAPMRPPMVEEKDGAVVEAEGGALTGWHLIHPVARAAGGFGGHEQLR